MERFTRNKHSQSSRSSMYSTDSTSHAEHHNERRSSSTDTSRTTSSRPVSYTPSYMSAIPRRKPAPIKTTSPLGNSDRTQSMESQTTNPPSTSARSPKPQTPHGSHGLLLIIVAAKPALNILSHIRLLLKRHALSGITIIGKREYEAPLKQLRLDTYGLIGQTTQDIGVQTYLRDGWSADEVAAVLHDAVGKVEEHVGAVLCVPGTEAIVKDGILSFGEEQMTKTWQQSFGFIHTIARSAFPYLLSHGQQTKSRFNSSFLVTQTIDQGAATMIMRSACGLLLKQLADTYRPQGVTVGYAEDVLKPEPEPEREPEKVKINGGSPALVISPASPQTAHGLGESPTQLWGLWALQEHFGD